MSKALGLISSSEIEGGREGGMKEEGRRRKEGKRRGSQ
jgi:hypothetical protein